MSKNWAICIGINDYKYVSSLKYARSDAQRMRDFCEKELGFDKLFFFVEGAPEICLDDGYRIEASPRFGDLDAFLDVQFSDRNFLNPQDNLWFFFAGHGLRSDGIDYLLPIDGNANRIEQTGLRIDYLSERLRRSGAGNIVLILDACRSGDSRKANIVGIGTAPQQGVVTICSCGPNEQAYEIAELGEGQEKGQGVFTYALLEGLRQEGPRNCATVDRLNGWLVRRVHELNEEYGKPRQTPVVKVDPAHKLHLVLLPDKATTHDTHPMRKAALLSEAKGELALARQIWINVLAVVRADLEAIQALERLAIRREKLSLEASNLSVVEAGKVTVSVSEIESENIEKKKEQLLSICEFEFEIVTVNRVGEIIKTEMRQTECRRETLAEGVDLDMVAIPGGAFLMGSSDEEENENEKPQHQVSVKPFLIGRYPVTQLQWRVVASFPKVEFPLNKNLSTSEDDSCPIAKITWYEAVEFCHRLSKYLGQKYRLPSEAEWEYACRAGTNTPFHFGETLTDELANYDATKSYADEPTGKYRKRTTDVRLFSANAFGLCSLHGNVWEWCSDHWHNNYVNAPTNGDSWLSSNENAHRVIRGGSWFDFPSDCCSAICYHFTPENHGDFIGFRVVSDTT